MARNITLSLTYDEMSILKNILEKLVDMEPNEPNKPIELQQPFKSNFEKTWVRIGDVFVNTKNGKTRNIRNNKIDKQRDKK